MVMYRANGALKRAPGIKLDMRAALYPTIAILARYGGSLWLADPAYTFTGSDGTGAAGDNSDAGYVRDLCASYGPELVVNGDFSVDANWTKGPGWSISGGSAVLTGDGTPSALSQNGVFTVGKTYQVQFDVSATGGAIGFENAAFALVAAATSGRVSIVWTADRASLSFKRSAGAVNATLDNVSVREIIGRPLLQPTTGFKPKLKRVPKKLGPELVTNGNFAVASGWVGAGTSSVVISGGQLTMTSSGAGYAARAESTTPFSLNVGSTYVLAVNTPSGGSFRLGSTQGQPQLYSSPALSAGYTAVNWVATAAQAYIALTGSSTSGVQNTFTQASVREVLEWGWAWVGDGTDDTLVSAAQPTTNTAETMGVAYWHTGTNSKGNSIHYLNRRNSAANLGMAIYQGAGSPSTSVIAGYGTNSTTALVSPTAFAGAVVSLQADGANMRRFLNGVQVGADIANPYSFATNAPIYLMSSQGGASSNTDRPIFAAYYAPAMLPAAERLIVERTMAQLAGVTI